MINRFPVMELFYTIQGEGYYSGTAAIFIRLAGCDVGCVWCDVKESWDASNFPKYSSAEILNQLSQYNCKTVVITGGEPAMYNLTPLCTLLKNNNYQIHIETSGAYQLNGYFDWVCFSPKKFKKPVDNFGKTASELKIIIFNNSDFKWAESYLNEVNTNTELYLQPEWDKKEEMMPLIVDYVKNNPKWKISLQTHKYIGIP